MSDSISSRSQEGCHEITNDEYFVNFNQPSSRTESRSLVVASRSGFKVFNLTTNDGLEKIYEYEFQGVSIIERCLNKPLVAVVFTSSPCKLTLINIKSQREITEQNYSHNIVGVKVNPSRVVVVLENEIIIMDSTNLKTLLRIEDTANNPTGVFALTPCDERQKLNILAYPGSNTSGEVCLFDITKKDSIKLGTIAAHESPLAGLTFSEDGFLLATASIKGTIIRVFNVSDLRKIIEFRRGLARRVTISSLVFSSDSRFLCCTSNTETVHIFKMNDLVSNNSMPTHELGWMEYCGSVISSSYKYLYSKVADVYENRAFASICAPFSGVKSVCAMTQVGKELRLLIATADGQLYVYSIDPAGKQECNLEKIYQFDQIELSSDNEGRIE